MQVYCSDPKQLSRTLVRTTFIYQLYTWSNGINGSLLLSKLVENLNYKIKLPVNILTFSRSMIARFLPFGRILYGKSGHLTDKCVKLTSFAYKLCISNFQTAKITRYLPLPPDLHNFKAVTYSSQTWYRELITTNFTWENFSESIPTIWS